MTTTILAPPQRDDLADALARLDGVTIDRVLRLLEAAGLEADIRVTRAA